MSSTTSTRHFRPDSETFNKNVTQISNDLHIFRQLVEYISTNAKTGLTLDIEGVGSVPCNKKAITNFEEVLRRRILGLKRDFSAKKQPKSNTKGQFSKPFYVSDQFRDFLANVDVGSEIRNSPDFVLVTNKGMVTSGLANSLLNAYQRLNNTKSNGVYMYTKEMEKYLSSTELQHTSTKGKVHRFTASDISSSVSDERRKELEERLSQSGPSVRKRLETDGGFSNGGYKPVCVVKIFNYFRIPSELLTSEQRSDLEKPKYVEAVARLSAISSEATRVARDARETARRAEVSS